MSKETIKTEIKKYIPNRKGWDKKYDHKGWYFLPENWSTNYALMIKGEPPDGSEIVSDTPIKLKNEIKDHFLKDRIPVFLAQKIVRPTGEEIIKTNKGDTFRRVYIDFVISRYKDVSFWQSMDSDLLEVHSKNGVVALIKAINLRHDES